jgi:hypothetical protein
MFKFKIFNFKQNFKLKRSMIENHMEHANKNKNRLNRWSARVRSTDDIWEWSNVWFSTDGDPDRGR